VLALLAVSCGREGVIVLSVDPGKIVGTAVWSEGKVMCSQSSYKQFLPWAESTVRTYMPWDLHVVCEDYIIGPQTLRKGKDARWPIGVAFTLEHWCDVHEVPFTLQSPSKGKAFSTDAKLKALGWYAPSPGGHKNDALRHLLVYLVDHGLIDPPVLDPA